MGVMCHVCKTVHGDVERVGRTDSCNRCGSDLHCCRNCRFYDPGAYNECREPDAERVVDSERANFCEYFEATAVSDDQATRPAGGNPLDALFRS